MRILGIKYTHDASIALIEDGVLRFSIEMEKISNRARRGKMLDLAWINQALDRESVRLRGIDSFVVDGWGGKRARWVPSSGYNEYEEVPASHPLARMELPPAELAKGFISKYTSFPHNAGHVMGGYAMSPFSKTLEDCVVISWDGGQSARAYLLQPRQNKIQLLGELLGMGVSVYTNMGLYFGPYKDPAVISSADIPHRKFGNVEWPGKLMGYLALGNSQLRLLEKMARTLSELPPCGLGFTQDSVREHQFLRALRDSGFSDVDVLASIQEFLGQHLVEVAREICPSNLPLVSVGGAALNIKWNSALARSGKFSSVWVPPVANDTGSAIGAAVCENHFRTGSWTLDWDVYSGPNLLPLAGTPSGWNSRPCNAKDLAAMLHARPQQPVVCLFGRAEIGPRALGHRSTLASATIGKNKDLLNKLKMREAYTPVAPVCLEREFARVFSPSNADQFMTFERAVNDDWKDRIPAIVHVDGSARAQSARSGTFIWEVLEHYFLMTGIPLLCNTSANASGCGFFDSADAALRWAAERGVEHVVANGIHYRRIT